ncbi:MAG: hypothetical protein ACTSXL_05210 [Alphaproteobacteria bacterium]|nr:MAG: hypothetical protein B6I23_01335 [Rickettsiaceae bacterium 4572_127]
MKNILFFTVFTAISSVSFAQDTSTQKSEFPICKQAKEDPKNKNYEETTGVNGEMYSCSFNRMFGSSYCQGLNGTFKKAFFSAGTCTIGGTTE